MSRPPPGENGSNSLTSLTHCTHARSPSQMGPEEASLPVKDEGWGFPVVLMRDLHGSAVTLLARYHTRRAWEAQHIQSKEWVFKKIYFV